MHCLYGSYIIFGLFIFQVMQNRIIGDDIIRYNEINNYEYKMTTILLSLVMVDKECILVSIRFCIE